MSHSTADVAVVVMSNAENVRNHCADVLVDLCEDMKLTDVSVTMLTRAAHISRPTFYKYFLDINDLIGYAGTRPLLAGEGPILEEERSIQALEYAKAHPGFFSQLARHTHGQNNFKDSYIQWMSEKLCALFVSPDLDEEERLHRQLQIELHCAGFLSIIFKWFADGMVLPATSIVRAIVAARPSFMNAGIELSPNTFPYFPHEAG